MASFCRKWENTTGTASEGARSRSEIQQGLGLGGWVVVEVKKWEMGKDSITGDGAGWVRDGSSAGQGQACAGSVWLGMVIIE